MPQHEENEKAYQRVTAEERTLIYRWRQEGRGTREIARRLERAASSICREFVCNMGMRGYRPKQAQEKAQAQAKRPGPRRFTDQVRADPEARLKEDWTPEMIGERARLEGRPWVCKETIYKHVYAVEGHCGRTFPAPSVSGGGAVPVKRGADEDESRTSE